MPLTENVRSGVHAELAFPGGATAANADDPSSVPVIKTPTPQSSRIVLIAKSLTRFVPDMDTAVVKFVYLMKLNRQQRKQRDRLSCGLGPFADASESAQ